MQPTAFHLTKQGASHIKKNKECQDASLSFSNEEYAIAIVCDGHGGDDYVRSATGASLACGIAMKNIVSFLHDVNKDELQTYHDQMFKTLEASIIAGWSTAIYDDYSQRPFTEEELSVLSEKAKKKYLEGKIDSAYGTTLIAVVLTTEFWFGLHIGDGKCVAINREGQFGQPIPWDEKCFLNATTSLSDSNAINNFRHFFSYKLPAAIFIGSDGIDDCFKNDQQLYSLYRTVLYSFATSDLEAAKADLGDYLPRLSAKGSGDDVSIAAVMDLSIIGELDTIKEYDREKEKARVEENARIAAEKAAEEKRRIEAERAEKQRQREEAMRAEEERRRQRIPVTRQKYCEYCGRLLRDGAIFCGGCGRAIRPKLPQHPSSPAPFEEKGIDVRSVNLTEEPPVEPEITTVLEKQQPDGACAEQSISEAGQNHAGNDSATDGAKTEEADAGVILEEDGNPEQENHCENEIAGESPVADEE